MSANRTDRVAFGNGYNGFPPAENLPITDTPDSITSNIKILNESIKDERLRFLFTKLIQHTHAFVNETNVTSEEWINTIHFLTKVGQTCTPLRQEFILLSDILGVSALVDAINNPSIHGATDSTVLGPFFTDDAPDLVFGDSIASEGKGDYLWVEGRVLSTDGKPIPDAIIETWETDESGFYDTQYGDRNEPDCRGRLRTDKDGRYGYRAVVPVGYPIPGDGPVGDLLKKLGRHNMRPNHLHMKLEAKGYRTLITSLFPEGDQWLNSDAVFGVKNSLIVSLKEVNDEAEARKMGFQKGDAFKVIEFDFYLLPLQEVPKSGSHKV